MAAPGTNNGDQNDLKTSQDYDERIDAENKQIFDDALHYGRSTETGPVFTPEGKEIIHNKIVDVVPGVSGKLEDMSCRTATQIPTAQSIRVRAIISLLRLYQMQQLTRFSKRMAIIWWRRSRACRTLMV
jgi:hypothetical protein